MNNDITIQEFIKYGASGIEVANFTEIRSAIIKRYKEIYGDDIDLSTANADGVFVNNLALIINNILQTFMTLYSNLSVNTATGTYLDTLCALSNITRKQPTYSNASILIKNVGVTDISNIKHLTFVDKAGNTWMYDNEDGLSLNRNETKEVSVTCSIPGSVEAPVGFINSLLEVYTLKIEQPNPANVGHELETDDELRARRNQSSGANGVAVLESMVGGLLTIGSMKDVYVYNNDSNINITAKDGTTVDKHSIYVITRGEEGVNISDSTIGTIIHSKLTPGIHSCPMDDSVTSGTGKSYLFLEKAYNMRISESDQYIYWKQAIGIHPSITIEIKTYEYFTSDEIQEIGNYINNYLNNLSISSDLDKNRILIQAVYADPKFKGNATYGVEDITISQSTNPDTYYHYTQVTGEQDEEDESIWTITLS